MKTAKTKKANPAKRCTCSHCGVEANAIADTYHRRCSGSPEKPVLAKHMLHARTGKWQ